MSLTKKQNQGFTLIELLVVVAIIGMLVSVIVVSFTTSRMRSRDAKRLNDMDQVKNGLDLYFLHAGGYPPPEEWVPGSGLSCNGLSILQIPADILTGYTYDYTEGGDTSTGCGTTIYSMYKVRFTTETQTEIGPAGEYFMYPGGFTATDPF